MIVGLVVAMGVLVCVDGGPIFIRTSVKKNHGQKENGDLYDATFQNGLSSLEGISGFNNAHDVKFVNAEDVGNFENELNKQKQHLDENNYADQKFHKNSGGSVSDFGSQIAHKKGHHKSGFHNTYHKDESGSNSSYYDDSDDTGDESVYDSRKGTYADVADQRRRGGAHDSARVHEGQAKRGGYNHGGGYKNDNGRDEYYKQKKYQDGNRRGQAQNSFGHHGEDGNYQEAYDERRPYYNDYKSYPQQPYSDYDDYYYESPNTHPAIGGFAKRTITIYEDPRYNDERYEDNSDYVHLDYRRPIGYERRYEDRRHYDDYY